MTRYHAERDPNRKPEHPGELLREDVLPSLDFSVAQPVKNLGVSRQTLHRVLRGDVSVTPTMALRLGKFCGNGPELWLNLQRAFDLWHAKRELADELAKIETHRAA